MLTVKEHLQQVCGYYPHPIAPQRCAEITGISHLAAKKYRELSGGQRRSLQYALAICGHPELIFLDEPTVGIDVRTRQQIWDHLRDLKGHGTGVLLTTHHMEEAEALADRIVVLNKGRIIFSGPASTISGANSSIVISCQTSIPIQTLIAHPAVLSVNTEGNTMLITTKDSDAIIRWLIQMDDRLSGISMRKNTLSDPFMRLTGAEEDHL